MMLIEKEDQLKGKERRGEFVRPSNPEHPKIHVFEKQETREYEAFFALELEGVVKNNDAANTRHDQNTVHERFRDCLAACLSAKQEIDFVYSVERNEKGRECFNWKIVGRSTGNAPELALHRAQQLWQGMAVLFGSAEKEYRFIPVNDPENITEASNEAALIKTIRPLGIAIDRGIKRKMGFLSQVGTKGWADTVIVPIAGDKLVNNLDSVLIEAPRCPAPVKLVVSILPFALSVDDLKKVEAALEWLQDGVMKRIKYHNGIEEGIDDNKVIDGLKNNLMLWLKYPSGFRVICKVVSEKPIPASFLKMLGNELFHGWSVTIEAENKKRDILPSDDLGGKAIDLRDCINSASHLPPLFPKTSTLMDYGIRRVYRQSTANLPDEGILLGRSEGGRDVRFARPDRSRHCYIVGATGTGKSALLYNMIVQDIVNGEGVAVVDPHGDLYYKILNSIPSKRAEDVILIDPCDFHHAVGINLLECNGMYKPVQMNFVVNEIIRIFERLYDMKTCGGPLFEAYMRNALLLAIDSDFPGATLMDIPAIFEDKDYRKFLLEKCKNEIVKAFWIRQAERAGGESSLENIAPYITCKLNQFTHNALLRPIIGQPKSTIDLRSAMDKGRILLVNLSKGLLGELDAQLLGMLIIGKIFSSAMSRVAQRPENRRGVFLYIDECQNFVTDSIVFLISEARKFGISLTLANQNLSQLATNSGKQNILDSVLGNVGSIIMLRLGVMDSEKMEAYVKPDLNAQDLQYLPDFYAAGRLLYCNTPSRSIVFKTLPMLQISGAGPVDEIIAASKRNYATPIEKIEKDIIIRKERYRYFKQP